MQPTSRDLQRAQAANAFVCKIKDSKDASEIRQELEALPALLRQHGLLQTLAFLMDDERKDRKKIGEDILKHLGKDQEKAGGAIDVCKPNDLRGNTEKAAAYVAWLKLMSKAVLPKPPKDQGGKEGQS